MSKIYAEEGSTIKGDRIVGEARKIPSVQVIVKSET